MLRPTGLALRARLRPLAQRKRGSAQPEQKVASPHRLMAQPPRLGKATFAKVGGTLL
jgi:hypothetical protein